MPYDDRESFQHRAGRMLDVSAPVEERQALQRESRAYMLELVARVRAEPGEDLLGMLAREHGDDLSGAELAGAELAGIGNLLLPAGHDTTSNMLALGVLALLRDPSQLEILLAEPGRADAAVEELLRRLSVVHSGTAKVAARDVEIAGRRIGAGDLIVCSLPAANRDPGLVPEPGALDLTRDAAGHLAFGHGAHHCLGAPLARMQLRIALPALFGRFPNLRVGEDDARFRSYHLIYGLTSLRVAW